MNQHLNFWKKVLAIYFAEVLILLLLSLLLLSGILGEPGRILLLTIIFGFIGLWYRDISALLGITPFILNGIFGLKLSSDMSIIWRVLYTLFLGLIIWPLVLLTFILVGKQLGLLHSY